MKTHSVKPSELNKKWVIVDAAGQTVGRLSTEIARVLRGKHKPTFVPYLDCGDNVVVVNADKVHFTGAKWQKKVYHNHSGYVGGLKSITAEELLGKYPDRILRTAVKGMLPHNKLGRQLIKNLKIYSGAEHPHEAQKPEPMAPRTAGSK